METLISSAPRIIGTFVRFGEPAVEECARDFIERISWDFESALCMLLSCGTSDAVEAVCNAVMPYCCDETQVCLFKMIYLCGCARGDYGDFA